MQKFKKHNPCPACGESNKGCSYKLSGEVLDVLFCRKSSPVQWEVIESQQFGKIKCNSPSTPGDRQDERSHLYPHTKS